MTRYLFFFLMALTTLCHTARAGADEFTDVDTALQNGDLDKATKILDRLIKDAPNPSKALMVRSKINFEKGDANAAFRDAAEAVRLSPGDPLPLDRRAYLFLMQRRYREAIADLDRSIALAPDAGRLAQRAAAFLGTKDYDKAIRDADHAIRLDRGLVQAYYNRGLARLALGEVKASVDDLTQVVRRQPDYLDALLFRARAYRMQDEFERALDDVHAAMVQCGKTPELYLERGLVYQAMRKFDLALADISKAIELRPKSVDALCKRAELQVRMGQMQAARLELGTALKLDPNHGPSHHALGGVLFLEGKYADAIKEFDLAVKTDPRARYFMNLGVAYLKLGQMQNALASLNEAVAICDRNPRIVGDLASEVRGIRAQIHRDMGNLAAALEDYTVAQKVSPRDYRPLHGKGITLLAMGKTDEAIDAFTRLIALRPNEPTYYLLRAEAYRAALQLARARADEQTARRLSRPMK
jgi:tetratricopeptide (TPR) repeat protein